MIHMEILDIVNEKDDVIGKEERAKAHERHLLHRVIHVIIANSKGQILLQLRKATKEQYPLYWNSSIAGHVSFGEDVEACAYREMQEEIGIETDLKFIGKFIINTDADYEMVNLFFGKSDGPFEFDEEEMEKAQFFDVQRLKKSKDNMKMTPHCKKALDVVFKNI